jgi:nucleoside-diphosphate-sugar epimerase
MHLVVGAAEYAGRYAIAELSNHFPVRGVELSEDLETAMAGVETVYMAAELHSPLLRLSAAPGPDRRLVKLVRLAEAAGVRRLVHLSTAQVLGPAPRSPLFEESPIKPYHAYEKLHARDERWLLGQRGIETVTLRPAQGFGPGEALAERLLSELSAGRTLLLGGGRAQRSFLAGPDLGRAFLAAGQRGRSGHAYLLGGFTACWRDLFKIVVDAIRLPVRFVDVPYDIAYLRAAFGEWRTPVGRERWPNRYAMDVLGRSHLLEDGLSRRELTWSPTIGSLDEARGELVEWAQGARSSRPEKPSEPVPETESLRGPEATSAPPAP